MKLISIKEKKKKEKENIYFPLIFDCICSIFYLMMFNYKLNNVSFHNIFKLLPLVLINLVISFYSILLQVQNI